MSYNFANLNDVIRIDRVVNRFERAGPLPLRQRFGPQLNQLPLIGIYNDSGFTVPPFGCVLIKGGQAQKGEGDKTGPAQGICMSVKRPDVFGCQSNGFIADEAGGDGYSDQTFGAVQQLPPFIALYDDADGTPAFGERWGPRSGTFKLKKNTGGFLVIGAYDTTNFYALVIPEPMISVRGKIAADCAPDTSADLTVWSGDVGSEATTSSTIASVYNDSDCTIRGTPKFATAIYVPLTKRWLFCVGRTA